MFSIVTTMATTKDWYWRSGDGKRIFSSARHLAVGPDDDAYKDWLSRSGRPATPWPKDLNGADSDDELNSVLLAYGLSMARPVRLATGNALSLALTDDQAKALETAKAKDRLRFSARGADPIPENNPLIARLATKASTTPAAWFDAALAPST